MTQSTTRELHEEAMRHVDAAIAARLRGNASASQELLRQALDKETAAVDTIVGDYSLEPTRAILHRSAVSLALQVGDLEVAQRYLESAFAGNPPGEIEEELMELDRELARITGRKPRKILRDVPSGLTPRQVIIRRFTANIPVDIDALARALGLEVEEADLPNVSGLIFRDPTTNSGFRIRVNAADPLNRRRFTKAHETAHYLLHTNRFANQLVDDRMYRSSLSTQLEADANRLAAQLLVPGRALEALQKAGVKDPRELASRFQVSLEVMERRLGLRRGRRT